MGTDIPGLCCIGQLITEIIELSESFIENTWPLVGYNTKTEFESQEWFSMSKKCCVKYHSVKTRFGFRENETLFWEIKDWLEESRIDPTVFKGSVEF